MVVHKDIGIRPKVKIDNTPMSEQKTYIIVKNHVREVIKTSENTFSNRNARDKSLKPNINKTELTKLVSKGNATELIESSVISEQTKNNIHNEVIQIDKNDLEELRTVYTKCKEVMTKIETKYGHLLNLTSVTSKNHNKRKVDDDDYTDTECHCTGKKKIIFGEDGSQSMIDMSIDKHICPKKLKKTYNISPTENRNIQIEYNDNEIELPNDLQELENILKDVDIGKTYRHKVIQKIKSIKLEDTNEIRFNRHALIEKLKTNPDELLDFRGSNLASLTGYI